MRVIDFYDILESLYPRSLSCEWDNDGIMCCADVSSEISKVMISLDATSDAIVCAANKGCDLLLTHHPMLFKSPRAVSNTDFSGKRVISSLKNGVTVISLHTRLDAGEDGVNDWLVKALGFESIGKFGDEDAPELGRFFEVEKRIDANELAAICKKKLNSRSVKITGKGSVKRIAAVGGSGSDLIKPAIAIGADALITGECSYNAAQDAFEDGLIIIEAGHYETEAPVCGRLADICASLDLPYEMFDSSIFTII